MIMKELQELNFKLQQIQKVFDIDKIINLKPTTASIANYYKLNKIAYTFFSNKTDLLHMGISRSGKYSNKDLLEQAKLVDKYVKQLKAKKVLELATGRGANSEYLAKEHPDIIFEAVDLPNGQLDYAFNKAKKLKNFHPKIGDYHNLTDYPRDSFDVIFVIEALCHSTNKKQVFSEVRKLLKNTGVFIIFDGYCGKKESLLAKNEQLAKKLTEKSMAVPDFDNYQEFKNKLINSGFKILNEEDMSEFIIPTLKRFENHARLYFKIPSLILKIINKFFPAVIINNVIPGYLLLTLVEFKTAKYVLTVASKKD